MWEVWEVWGDGEIRRWGDRESDEQLAFHGANKLRTQA
ncbi:hypothetical protein LYNGBM3L_46040 [Moorena producens 3L]|uniref:Uncharacterized protein n=1 Tax=Moorena producens 3L TaxID=489825 RepID=F4XX64_9CYAN|nr:hypothetical protein LYNGBM3L_46040 [Moorena producens 3L]